MSLETKKERVLALDVLRGLMLTCMVLVNSAGDPHQTYTVLKHASWHGWAIADLVFPFFLFIVGVAIPFSIESRLSKGDTHKRIVLDALRRAIFLFAIGLAMNWYVRLNRNNIFDFAHLRFFNVLQRIGICYFFGTLMYLWCRPRTHVVIGASLLVFYFVLMKFVPVPGYGAGVLDRVGNWAQYIDSHVMGAHCGSTYKGFVYEGKGLLATLPAFVTALMGIWTGRQLRQPGATSDKLVKLYFFGTLSLLLGACWDQFFPINQNLWTGSLVLFMGGMAMVALASCYYVADVRKITWWTRWFVVFGVNSIAVWVGSVVLNATLEKINVYEANGKMVTLKTCMFNGLADWFGPRNGSLAFAVLYVLFWWAIMRGLYRRKIYFKV